MSVIKPQLYICYNCDKQSLKMVIYSYTILEPLIYRTDGYCTNHPVNSNSDFIMYCPHCETFLLTEKLKPGRERTEEERTNRIKKEVFSFFDARKNYFHGSKKWSEALKTSKKAIDNENPNELKYFVSVRSCSDIGFALKAPELKNETEILYQLQLMYWRKNNYPEYSFDEDTETTESIYKKLMATWEGKTDEKYLYKAEMLRNMGKFKESNELLKKPLSEYEPILVKHKKWAKVIKTLNGLKYKRSFEINI